MKYTVLRIDEDIEFGCEERSASAPVMAVVTLRDETGKEQVIRHEDQLLYQRKIEEGDQVILDEHQNLWLAPNGKNETQDAVPCTPYQPAEYDTYIKSTLPYAVDFYEQAASIVGHYSDPRGNLLDLGCGAGMFEKILRERFPELQITGVDPNPEMLAQAKAKGIPEVIYREGTIHQVAKEESYDIITAIMSHHFMQPPEREAAVEMVYQSLKPNGIYIAFENVIPEAPELKDLELSRWERFQVEAGKPAEQARIHKTRCGTYYFPITVEEHIALLKRIGFRSVYVFWRSYMQMGIMGIK